MSRGLSIASLRPSPSACALAAPEDSALRGPRVILRRHASWPTFDQDAYSAPLARRELRERLRDPYLALFAHLTSVLASGTLAAELEKQVGESLASGALVTLDTRALFPPALVERLVEAIFADLAAPLREGLLLDSDSTSWLVNRAAPEAGHYLRSRAVPVLPQHRAAFRPFFDLLARLAEQVTAADRDAPAPPTVAMAIFAAGPASRGRSDGQWHVDDRRLSAVTTLLGPTTEFTRSARRVDRRYQVAEPAIERAECGTTLFFSGRQRIPLGIPALVHRAPAPPAAGRRLCLRFFVGNFQEED